MDIYQPLFTSSSEDSCILFLDSISLFVARVAGPKRGRGKGGRARAAIEGLVLGNSPNLCKVKILVKIKAENVIVKRGNNLVS